MVNGRIAHYEITGKLGQGGMGEVYRATDTKLGREVAIKVLPESFDGDRNRIARFEREAKVLAALNHPNIAIVHGIEQRGDAHALIMELVEGPTLAEHLEKETLPLDETLDICRGLAEALEAAHEKGIIHRDLKPDNTKITPEAQVKVLDFGLAKAVEKGSLTGNDLTRSAQVTLAGTLLGTPAYMSPEQAKGKPVDRRTDIWAFGCTLYECLAGAPAFAGETSTEVLGAVMHTEPDWTLLPTETPHSLLRLLKRCLTKDAHRRLHDIADARIEIEDLMSKPSGDTPVMSHRSPYRQWVVMGIMLALCLGFMQIERLIRLSPKRNAPSKTSTESAERTPYQRRVYTIPLAKGTSLSLGNGNSIAVSPDGEHLVVAAEDANGMRRLYQREIASGQKPKVIPGTEHAMVPFFSPDGQWVCFFDRRFGKVVRLDGSQPETFSGSPPHPKGTVWLKPNVLVGSTDPHFGLYRLWIAERKWDKFTKLAPENGEYGHLWPAVLPNEQGILFTAWDGLNMENAKTMVKWSDSGLTEEWIPNSTAAQYVPTGHIVFMRSGSLWGQAFAGSTLGVQSDVSQAVPLITHMGSTFFGAGQYAFSQNGDLIYAEAESPQGLMRGRLVWVDLSRNKDPIPGSEGYYDRYACPRLSPENRQLVVGLADTTDILLLQDTERGAFLPVTHLQGIEYCPVWIRRADQDWIAFHSSPAGRAPDMVIQELATNETTVLAEGADITATKPFAYSAAQDVLICTDNNIFAENKLDISLYDLDSQTRRPWPGNTSRAETQAAVSPDGAWIAYVSDIGDDTKILVKAFSGQGQPLIIGHGNEPVWHPQNASEFFYRDGQSLIKAELQTEPILKLVKTIPLFPDRYVASESLMGHRCYDVARDGSRFLMVEWLDQQPPPVTQLKVIVNWFDELREKIPTGG